MKVHLNTSVLEASVELIEQPFIKPLQISSGLITTATEARATVRVRVGAREACGYGSIYLSDLWAWPGLSPERKVKQEMMRSMCLHLAATLDQQCGGEAAHPLELGLRLHHSLGQPGFASPAPFLARSVCASPFDAAIHDAVGQALVRPSFAFYETAAPIPSADHYFRSLGAAEAIRRMLRPPVTTLDAWWLVSSQDDLEAIVRPAIKRSGYRCFKIKVLAHDNAEDAERTAEVYRAVRRAGVSDPVLSVDSNEANPDAASVLDYLERLEAIDPDAYAALSYLEQPTGRDILASPQDWRTVNRRKPVMLDEGLTSMDLLPAAKDQGWSGLALKTCKGHSFALVSAAWAREQEMLLSLQDLTNPGYAAIHAFLFGAHVSTINGVELNSPQYTPAANEPWMSAAPDLFRPRHGVHHWDGSMAPGLGSTAARVPAAQERSL